MKNISGKKDRKSVTAADRSSLRYQELVEE